MASFKIGVDMAGAVSAGAYTAGVLDFLTEALDEWYRAKARGECVPAHDVSIEVLSGASAGGMCAAISAAMLQEDFEHIHDTAKHDTNNRLYESWVNKIDIVDLLQTGDLKQGPPVVSLLDSAVIDQIAKYALTPGIPTAVPRPYVSPNLTLFLSLTNLRGTPYSLNGAAPGSIEETTFFYGDRIRFETVRADATQTPSQEAHLLDLSQGGTGPGWDLLQTAAMATGAFPAFLAPRILSRSVGEYTPPMWESVTFPVNCTPPPISPNFPAGLHNPLETLNVDGGVTNNDPFNYAHDYLASLNPALPSGQIARDAVDADRAVIGVAPFPTTEEFDLRFDLRKNSDIFFVLPRLFTALISQSRFFGESLREIMTGTTFSRFVIAPSIAPSEDDPVNKDRAASAPSSADQSTALQCAALGAFGGFFERGFRAHDYQLGRRNCQKFLRDRFVLPVDNVILGPAFKALDPAAQKNILTRFGRPAPGAYADPPETPNQGDEAVPAAKGWLPIIPLCASSVSEPVPLPKRVQITGDKLKRIVSLILKRFRALVFRSLQRIPFWPLRIFLWVGQPFIAFLARQPLRKALIKQLGASYRPS